MCVCSKKANNIAENYYINSFALWQKQGKNAGPVPFFPQQFQQSKGKHLDLFCTYRLTTCPPSW